MTSPTGKKDLFNSVIAASFRSAFLRSLLCWSKKFQTGPGKKELRLFLLEEDLKLSVRLNAKQDPCWSYCLIRKELETPGLEPTNPRFQGKNTFECVQPNLLPLKL